MILFNAFIGYFAIFVSPQIFIYYKYRQLSYPLVLASGLILSFSISWIFLLVLFHFNIDNAIVYLFSYGVTIASLLYMYVNKIACREKNQYFGIWLLTLVLLLPFFSQIGVGFSSLDAAASWNRWAIELFENKYNPIDAAYPILMPAIWALIYKIQGTNEIWWTAQISLFVIPVFIFMTLFSLYLKNQNKTYILMALFIYPYFITRDMINGNMDMPVMMFGILSLILLYAAEEDKKGNEYEYYVYTSLLIAGIASITKQAGLAFVLFDMVYIAINAKSFIHKKRLILVLAITILYFLSFLSLYYTGNSSGITDNIDHLENLSSRTRVKYDTSEYLQILYHNFFDFTANVPQLSPLRSLTGVKAITPFLIILGLFLFIFKGLRRYASVSFLSAVFFIIGTLLWIKYFSYDYRNSLWIKAFLIMFLSINLGYIFSQYKHRPIYTKLLIAGTLLMLLFYALFLGNTFAYQKQKQYQIYVGKNPKLAQYAANLLKNKQTCSKIYTNELALPYNYYVKKYQDNGQFVPMGRDYKFQNFNYLEHNCTDGRYIIFRITSTIMDEWWKVEKLYADGKIKKIKKLVYWVPPNLKIEKGYFDRHSKVIDIKLSKHENKVKYALDKITQNNKVYIVSGWAFISGAQVDHTKKYIVLKNSKNQFVLTTDPILRRDVTKYFKAKDLDHSGFSAYIDKNDFPKGKYDISILLIDRLGKQYISPLKQKIEL